MIQAITDENIEPVNLMQGIQGFFVGERATYGELQKIRLIFKLFNADNDLGNDILEAIEADWKNSDPEEGFDDAYLDGVMTGLELSEEIEDRKRQRHHELRTKTTDAS